LLSRALHAVFTRRVEMDRLAEVIDAFEGGSEIETGDSIPSREYVRWMRETPGLEAVVKSLNGLGSPSETASTVEFVLEGLHLNRRLNKDRVGSGARYRH